MKRNRLLALFLSLALVVTTVMGNVTFAAADTEKKKHTAYSRHSYPLTEKKQIKICIDADCERACHISVQ